MILFSPLVVSVCRLCQGPCWVLGLQTRTPRIPSWPTGLMLSRDSGAPFLWVTWPSSSFLEPLSTFHLPGRVRPPGTQIGKEVIRIHLWKNSSGRLTECGLAGGSFGDRDK